LFRRFTTFLLDYFITYMKNTELDKLLGKHVGLNADWCVCAWRLRRFHSGAWYLLDNEDDTFSSVFRSDYEEAEPEVICTIKAEDVIQFLTINGLI